MPTDWFKVVQTGAMIIGGVETALRVAGHIMPQNHDSEVPPDDYEDAPPRKRYAGNIVMAGIEDFLMDLIPGATAAKQQQLKQQLQAERQKSERAQRDYVDKGNKRQDDEFRSANTRQDNEFRNANAKQDTEYRAAVKRLDARDVRHDQQVGHLQQADKDIRADIQARDKDIRTGISTIDKELRAKLDALQVEYGKKVAEVSDKLAALATKFDEYAKSVASKEAQAVAMGLQNMAKNHTVSFPTLDSVSQLDAMLAAFNAGKEQDFLASATGMWGFQGWGPNVMMAGKEHKEHCECGGSCSDCSKGMTDEQVSSMFVPVIPGFAGVGDIIESGSEYRSSLFNDDGTCPTGTCPFSN